MGGFECANDCDCNKCGRPKKNMKRRFRKLCRLGECKKASELSQKINHNSSNKDKKF